MTLLFALVAACRHAQRLVLLVLNLPRDLIETPLAQVIFRRCKQLLHFPIFLIESELEGVLVLLASTFFLIAMLATACRHFIKLLK